MNNIMQQIVTEEVKRQYQTEKVFYENTLAITQQSWNRWKKGERGLKHEKMNLIKSLFTFYEWMLIEKIAQDMSVFPQNFAQNPWSVYIESKKSIAKEWAETAEIKVDSALNVDDSKIGKTMPGTRVTVSVEHNIPLLAAKDSLVFYTDQSSAHIKAGKRNRLEWFMKNVDDLK